jgi:hypothetical protein
MKPQRRLELERRRAAEVPASTDGAERVPPGVESAVLALQRSAGNVAVSRWLQRAPAGLLQRDRKLPDDADSLTDLGAVAKDLIVDKDTVSIPGLPFHFKSPRVPARPGLKVTTEFGGDMAAKPDPDKEKSLRDGLGSIGMIIFGLDGERPKSTDDMPAPTLPGGIRRPPTGDRVNLKDLDLTPFGGKDGRYRFTAVIRKQSRGQLREVDLIVELLGARRQALKVWADLDAATRKKLVDRFRRFGFVKREVRPEDTDAALAWKDDDFGKVLQALELIPDDMLQGVQGITWVRGHQPSAPVGEAGFYETRTGLAEGETPVRTLTVRGDAFATDDSLISVVAHEIGHAISAKPTETGGTALPADTSSAGFKAAAKADSALAITKYGQTNMVESYAEAYSMFIAEPDTLKALRPKTFEWFEKQQAAAKPPAAKPPAKPPAATGAKP